MSTVPDLPYAERTHDVDAWRERMAAKGQRARHFLDLDEAALASSVRTPRRPRTAPQGPGSAEQDRPSTGNYRIVPCVGCGRQTRSGSVPLAMAPDTVVRAKHDRCTRCHRAQERAQGGAAA